MIEFLTRLTDEDRKALLDVGERRHFEANEVILREGIIHHSIFLIVSGVARVERSHAEFYVEIARLVAGEIFGEMSFVEDYETSASVVADEPTEVVVFEEAGVQRLIESDPGFRGRFYHSIAEILSRRLRETTADGIAEYAWGGGVLDGGTSEAERNSTEDLWGGGSPIREFADE